MSSTRSLIELLSSQRPNFLSRRNSCSILKQRSEAYLHIPIAYFRSLSNIMICWFQSFDKFRSLGLFVKSWVREFSLTISSSSSYIQSCIIFLTSKSSAKSDPAGTLCYQSKGKLEETDYFELRSSSWSNEMCLSRVLMWITNSLIFNPSEFHSSTRNFACLAKFSIVVSWL